MFIYLTVVSEAACVEDVSKAACVEDVSETARVEDFSVPLPSDHTIRIYSTSKGIKIGILEKRFYSL